MRNSKLKKLLAVTIAAVSISTLHILNVDAAWVKDSIGWWNTEGNSWSVGWRNIDGKWYYFDSQGYMKTGWLLDGGKWYYLNTNGDMAVNTVIDNYTIGSDGAWIEKIEAVINDIKVNANSQLNKPLHNQLIVSLFDENEKGSMVAVNLNNGSVSDIIKDRNVEITGDISLDGSKAVYVDALTDYDQWQIYSCDLESKTATKVKTNDYGKVHARVADNDSIYFLTATEKNVVKVGKVDSKTNEYSIIDGNDADRESDAFDVKNDTIVISTESRSEQLEKYEENDCNYQPIIHTIFKSDLNGSKLEKIGEIKSSYIGALCISYDGKKIIIGGEDINGDSGDSIYEMDVESGHATKILSKDILDNIENSNIKEIESSLVALSKDGKNVYLMGESADSQKFNVAGITSYSKSIFSYNKETKEIKKIYTPTSNSMIADLNIKY